jgi:hypothetical protein
LDHAPKYGKVVPADRSIETMPAVSFYYFGWFAFPNALAAGLG